MKITFPNGEQHDFERGKPIIILGANGSGKTRLSAKIEEINDPSFHRNQMKDSHIHRLSAQKSLTIPNSIPIYDLESSKSNLYLGNSDQYANKSNHRYHSNPATCLLDDYQQALSLLFAEAQRELQEEHDKAMDCSSKGDPIPKPSDTVVDKAQRIWNTLLPHRTIDLSGNGVHVTYQTRKYHGKEMSDGERVMLYMICQALVVKPNTLFIIDEPELHIHKAIVKELWTQLENERPDCIFMYVTHDIDFALSRNDAQFLWIKSFDGTNWDYEFFNATDYPDLPSDLLLEILGTRQKIVFVEGTKSSYDYKLYQEIYREKGYHVIPCDGCDDVIRVVKAKRTYEKLQAIEVYGIIDRDYRTEREIKALNNDGIFVLSVAEIENLFVVPEVLEIMESQLGCDPGTANSAKDFIVEMFNGCKAKQVSEAFSKEITHQLSLVDFGTNEPTREEIKHIIDDMFSTENMNMWRKEKETIYNSASSLQEILQFFNFKKLSHIIASKYGLSDKDFPNRVINVLTNNKDARVEMLAAFSQYVPELP